MSKRVTEVWSKNFGLRGKNNVLLTPHPFFSTRYALIGGWHSCAYTYHKPETQNPPSRVSKTGNPFQPKNISKSFRPRSVAWDRVLVEMEPALQCRTNWILTPAGERRHPSQVMSSLLPVLIATEFRRDGTARLIGATRHKALATAQPCQRRHAFYAASDVVCACAQLSKLQICLPTTWINPCPYSSIQRAP